MITLYLNDYDTSILFNVMTKKNRIPLVGSKVFFEFISKATNRRFGGGECEVMDVALGISKYTFKNNELSQEGEFQGRVIIDLTQGAKRESLALNFKVVRATKSTLKIPA